MDTESSVDGDHTSRRADGACRGMQIIMTSALLRGHRSVAILLAVGLLLAWLPAGSAWGDARDISDDLCQEPYQSDFDDVEGSAHLDNILCMADRDLTEGVGDGSSYAPRRDVTRGQMASFVARFLEDYFGTPLPAGDPDRFDDVPANDGSYPHATNIHSLAEIEVVDGTAASDGQAYAPQAGVTRAQMASMIRRALAWADDEDARNDSAPPPAAQSAFGDTAGSVHEPNIDAIAAVGIVEGFDDDTYRPNDPVKRDQMASFVMRSYDYAVEAQLDRGAVDAPTVTLLSPTSDTPARAAAGEEVEVTFASEHADDYEIDVRASADGDWTALGGDASGEVTDDETTADVRVPNGTEPGTYDLRVSVSGDGGAATDIAPESLQVTEPGPVTILSPTTDEPAFPVSPGDEVDITFRTEGAGDYELEFRNPDPEPDTFLGFPIPGEDDDEAGPWTEFEGGDASGTVAAGGEHDVTVTLPENGDEGVRDIRLSFTPTDDPSTTIISRQDAALIVGDGLVVNLTEGRVDFEMQAALDEAEDGHVLMAFGTFEEAVEIENDDLLLSGVGPEDTVLEGSIVIEGVDGVVLSDMTITEYTTHSALGLGLVGDEIGLVLADARDLTLRGLALTGGGSDDTDDVGIEAGDDVTGAISDSEFTANDIGVHLSGDAGGLLVGEGNHVHDNRLGVFVDGDARGATVAGNEFEDNTVGVRVDAISATVEDNAFAAHGDLALDLNEGAHSATVEDNAFSDSNAEHIRYDLDDYLRDHADTLIADNTFDSTPIDRETNGTVVIEPESDDEDD